MPIPIIAKMIWKASEMAIWERAARREDTGSGERWSGKR